MTPVSFTILVRGAEHTLTAYEPLEGAAFVVHRDLGGGREWAVTHRGSTFVVTYMPTRREAIELAGALSRKSRYAHKVKSVVRDNGAVELVGPHRKLVNELRPFLEAV